MLAKGIGRKLCAFVLAFVMVLPFVGVEPVTVKADDTSNSGAYLKLQIEYKDYGNNENTNLRDLYISETQFVEPRLEVDDEFYIYVTAKDTIDTVKNISLELQYDAKIFGDIDQSSVRLVTDKEMYAGQHSDTRVYNEKGMQTEEWSYTYTPSDSTSGKGTLDITTGKNRF
jgi:hypothetical protein